MRVEIDPPSSGLPPSHPDLPPSHPDPPTHADTPPRFDPPPTRPWPDHEIAALAVTQHGVFTFAQLASLGLSQQRISRRVVSGRLHRIHRGVYALTPRPLLRPTGWRMAAVLACGEAAALSHHTAAHQHELLSWAGSAVDVTVAARAGRRRPDIRLHRSATLRPEDITTVNGIPTTTVARTLLDLAAVLPADQLDRALDRALMLNVFDLATLHDQLFHNQARLKAATRLQAALASHRPDELPDWNAFEDRFLRLIRAAGLPDPEIQPYLDLGDGEELIHPDFLWRAERLIVELDSWGFHGGRSRFEHDRRRDQRATAAGYRNLRVTWAQLTGEPARLISTLCAATGASATSACAA